MNRGARSASFRRVSQKRVTTDTSTGREKAAQLFPAPWGLNRHYRISAFFVVSLFYRRFVAFSLVPLQIFSVYVLIFRFSALSFGTHIELHRCSFQQCLYDAQKSAAATSFSSALLTILTRFARLSAVKNTRRIESNARAGYHYEADPDDTSPLGVMRFDAPDYDNINNQDLLTKISDRFYPTIRKEKFAYWTRDPMGRQAQLVNTK